ncbi:MAG TPA: diacylglycerol kinase family protein [Candidatus Deferrimicrobium sp.]|nr:diacylglycerol kinase family protein [Candidatus Deferrimicrobium sp.]
MRQRHQKDQHAHYYVLVNSRAAGYNPKAIEKLTRRIRQQGWFYTVYEGESAEGMVRRARLVCGLVPATRPAPDYMQRRGAVTALIACGGDGTVNGVAEVAAEADLPMGILPAGRFNNIARALCDRPDIDSAIDNILKRNYRKIDTATVSGRFFLGSLGLGLFAQLARLLEGTKTPRFGFSWGRLAAKAAAAVEPTAMSIAIDSFRFDVRPSVCSVCLLPFTVGFPLSPTSQFDDRQAEVIFDGGDRVVDTAAFIKQTFRRKYSFRSEIKLYRGGAITIQPVADRTLYLDGELVNPPSEVLEIRIAEKQLKVYC